MKSVEAGAVNVLTKTKQIEERTVRKIKKETEEKEKPGTGKGIRTAGVGVSQGTEGVLKMSPENDLEAVVERETVQEI